MPSSRSKHPERCGRLLDHAKRLTRRRPEPTALGSRLRTILRIKAPLHPGELLVPNAEHTAWTPLRDHHEPAQADAPVHRRENTDEDVAGQVAAGFRALLGDHGPASVATRIVRRA